MTRPAFVGIFRRPGGQPYDEALAQLVRTALTDWQPADGLGGVDIEHVNQAGENLIPEWARARGRAQRALVGETRTAAIRVQIQHEADCASQIGTSSRCLCSTPTVSLIRPPRAAP